MLHIQWRLGLVTYPCDINISCDPVCLIIKRPLSKEKLSISNGKNRGIPLARSSFFLELAIDVYVCLLLK